MMTTLAISSNGRSRSCVSRYFWLRVRRWSTCSSTLVPIGLSLFAMGLTSRDQVSSSANSLGRIVAGCTRGPAGLCVHSLPEIVPALLGPRNLSSGALAGPLCSAVEQHEESPRPPVQDPAELPPVEAPQPAQFALDLRAGRARPGASGRA